MAGGGSRRPARSRPKQMEESSERDAQSKFRRPKSGRASTSLNLMDINLKFLLALGILSFSIIVFVIYRQIGVQNEKPDPLPRSVTPLPAPRLMDLPQFQGEHRESLYWGTYRPQVYFGVRARTPKSLIAGLMWIGIKDGRYFVRHVCQDSDGLSTYGWIKHNGRDYGHQVLKDHGLTITTKFVKAHGPGRGYGGDWAVRLEVQANETSETVFPLGNAHLFFYLADEGGGIINIEKKPAPYNPSGNILASGTREDIGAWGLSIFSKEYLEIHYSGFRSHHFHNLTELVEGTLAVKAMMGQLELLDTVEDSSNIAIFQISAKLPSELDLAFVSGSNLEDAVAQNRVKNLTGTQLTALLDEKEADFEMKYDRRFNLSRKVESDSVLVGKAAVANLLGGIGYFYGQSDISVSTGFRHRHGDLSIPYWPASLFTAVPSRSLFPRGFLWDEGFHQLVIWRWDVGLCLDILGHWLDLINIDGWIPREQILGAEARSKVPEEFIVQHPANGNPPTLFLVLQDLIQGMKKNWFTRKENTELRTFLDRAFLRLEAWVKWFNTTQLGRDPGYYYWHGRDDATMHELNPKTLMSGLDDYPRASHPNEEERHLDLRCWMLMAADCMHSIAQLLEPKSDIEKAYLTMYKKLSNFDDINKMHYDEASGAYYDYGNHTEKVSLRWQEVRDSRGIVVKRELIRVVSENPHLGLVPHVGYVSLFPLMMKLIPSDSPILEKQLNLISNGSILWTNYGLRSLSKTSTIYMKFNTEHDGPYWRGPIWINMNYMVLSSLKLYSQESGPYQTQAKEIYDNLRNNLIRNIVNNYHKTGYLWEQYDERNGGKGKGAHPFTGWTALCLLIMADAY